MIRSTRWLKDFLWTIALAGLVGAIFRLSFGLGRTTALTDAVPWGLWKILNMVAGVALSTCGFTVGFLVYVLRLERLRPLVKPAILVAFLGYGSSCLALFFDIGLPLSFWHPFVMWNPHSFLFEVFWCVILYFTVTMVELAPTVLERLGGAKAAHRLHRIAFGVVVLGISLSSLHHSSLGSLFLVTPLRLHGLWYTPLLPLMFILSAMGGGMMFLVLVRLFHARYFDPAAVWGEGHGKAACPLPGSQGAVLTPLPPTGRDWPLLQMLATLAAWILGVYLALKLGDLVRTGAWRLLLAGTWESWLWGLELMLTAILPVLLLAIPRTRRSVDGLGIAAASAAAGLALNRLDVGILGYWRDAGQPYFPSLLEWAVGLGVVAAAGLAFLAAVEYLPIFSGQPRRPRPAFKASFDSFTRVWNAILTSGPQRVAIIALWVLPVAWVLLYPPYAERRADDALRRATLAPALAADANRAVLHLDGDRRSHRVDFAHASHQQRLGGETGCAVCHHLSLPGDRSTPCGRCHRDMIDATPLFDHGRHMAAVATRDELAGPRPANLSCGRCHLDGEPKLAATAVGCLECHRQDMLPPEATFAPVCLARASSYQDAVHGVCVPCHLREAPAAARPALGECRTCHPAAAEPTLAALPR